MNARSKLADWFENYESIPYLLADPYYGGPAQLAHVILDERAKELSYWIRWAASDEETDLISAGLPPDPRYIAGMRAAADLIDPQAEFHPIANLPHHD